MNEPAFFQQDGGAIVHANKTLATLQAELEHCLRTLGQTGGPGFCRHRAASGGVLVIQLGYIANIQRGP